MAFIYSLSVRAYAFLIRIASLWNAKAKKWMRGRAVVWEQLNGWEKREGVPVYWFHCASLGEFEQGRPVIEELKKNDCQIIITFFSPSGYEIRKNYNKADLVIYLPRETKRNVKRFLSIAQPDKVFFIKYEFWAHYIFEAKSAGAELYSVSAVFRKSQTFFKSYGGYMRKVLGQFDQIFVQDQKSLDLLKTIDLKAILTGDTRYDRVMQNAQKVQPYPEIEAFIDKQKVLVVGSSWGEDEQVIERCLNQDEFDWKVIIAPHEIGNSRVEAIEKRFKRKSIRYSAIEQADATADILIIDNIGMLMNVYQYADLAYVGGAFGSGLHNILEPACFGVPVIFGNKYQKFNEAYDFIKHKVGYSIDDSASFATRFNKLKQVDKKEEVLNFMKDRVGATSKIIAVVE